VSTKTSKRRVLILVLSAVFLGAWWFGIFDGSYKKDWEGVLYPAGKSPHPKTTVRFGTFATLEKCHCAGLAKLWAIGILDGGDFDCRVPPKSRSELGQRIHWVISTLDPPVPSGDSPTC